MFLSQHLLVKGMSVANHKKGDELNRNSLVIESILLTKEIQPRFFIFENVRAFLNTICTDIDQRIKQSKKQLK
jgi:DNA (cytosine-5)-methyltransferase 1